MPSMESKRRNSKKKSPAIELPSSVLVQYSRIENLLRHSLSRKWLRYEFEYDAVEDAFFKQNKSKSFESIVSDKFPSLESCSLTMVEWRKIRKLLLGQKTRRFSAKFVEQQRIDLEKYRRCYNVLRENQRDDQLVKLNAEPSKDSVVVCDARAEFEIYRLIVETKKQFASKSATVAELREINSAKTEGRNVNDDEAYANATKAIVKLRDVNDEITKGLRKLLHFQIVKDALLFDALGKKKLCLALSPVYFRRKCQLRIYEDHRDFRLDTFIESVDVMQLMYIMLELVLSLFEYELLAINTEDYIKTVLKQHLDTLKSIMITVDFEYFNGEIAPLMSAMAKKVIA
ncbi:uncharacterized protein LOC129569456 [Sitodiplosis mosellana]|uniref:uncharacterized protein LOC129569456 n=1 Tax=Sitodiplosis mosellana TaxID=263140 RepID=UPI002443DF52|nr:uncharacterized protein LOC129569456 [Sitodiplosis mosellana]